MSNIVFPDKTAHYKPSHLHLRCLQKPVIIDCGSERVQDKTECTSDVQPLVPHICSHVQSLPDINCVIFTDIKEKMDALSRETTFQNQICHPSGVDPFETGLGVLNNITGSKKLSPLLENGGKATK